jgi:protein-tyrosine-phosphatase
MAEAFLRKYAGGIFEAHSAGLEPKGVNPLTIQMMKEAGIDISGQTSKGIETYLGRTDFHYLITVCDDADQNCPGSRPECTGPSKIRLDLKVRRRKSLPSFAGCEI